MDILKGLKECWVNTFYNIKSDDVGDPHTPLYSEDEMKHDYEHYVYNPPKVLETIEGSYKDWEKFMLKYPRLVLVLGARRCMPKGTLIRTPKGLEKIEEVNQVLSYNLNKNKVETKNAIVYPSGKKQVVRIKTSKGIIECSPNHKWIIIRNKEIIETETKDLYTTDYLLLVNDVFQK